MFVALLWTFSSFSISGCRDGLHTWMQYSNCGLTNVLYNLSIVSLSLVTIVILIIPKVELAFVDASAHCLDGFALLCIITPKSLSSSPNATVQHLTSHFIDNSWFLFPMCIT